MQINDLIPISDYAAHHGVKANTIRVRCSRGTLPGAVKLGRDWFIPADAPYTDSRVKSGQYKSWRKKEETP